MNADFFALQTFRGVIALDSLLCMITVVSPRLTLLEVLQLSLFCSRQTFADRLCLHTAPPTKAGGSQRNCKQSKYLNFSNGLLLF